MTVRLTNRAVFFGGLMGVSFGKIVLQVKKILYFLFFCDINFSLYLRGESVCGRFSCSCLSLADVNPCFIANA